jgi:mRNA-degrading endonuclease RelE of RelBE toxin-antitoxin system
VSWDFRLSNDAARSLRRMGARDRERINRALNDMKREPLGGDVTPLRGEYQGSFRRRVGPWRIIFLLDLEHRVIDIYGIRRRSSTTYR